MIIVALKILQVLISQHGISYKTLDAVRNTRYCSLKSLSTTELYVSDVVAQLEAVFEAKRKLEKDNVRQDSELTLVRLKLVTTQEWNARLTDKIAALEAARPWGPDGWDEQFFFDKQVTITFRKKWQNEEARAQKITIDPKVGPKTIVFGSYKQPLLRRAIEQMNGRKRASSEQQESPQESSTARLS